MAATPEEPVITKSNQECPMKSAKPKEKGDCPYNRDNEELDPRNMVTRPHPQLNNYSPAVRDLIPDPATQPRPSPRPTLPVIKGSSDVLHS